MPVQTSSISTPAALRWSRWIPNRHTLPTNINYSLLYHHSFDNLRYTITAGYPQNVQPVRQPHSAGQLAQLALRQGRSLYQFAFYAVYPYLQWRIPINMSRPICIPDFNIHSAIALGINAIVATAPACCCDGIRPIAIHRCLCPARCPAGGIVVNAGACA